MNVPTDVAHRVIDSMKAAPFVLAILIINCFAMLALSYSLHEISKAAERRDGLLQTCLAR